MQPRTIKASSTTSDTSRIKQSQQQIDARLFFQPVQVCDK